MNVPTSNRNRRTIIIFCFCALLWALNWNMSEAYVRPSGVKGAGVNAASLAGLLSIIWAAQSFQLLRTEMKLCRRRGMQILPTRWIASGWKYLMFLTPLLFGWSRQWSFESADGTAVTRTFSYGAESSIVVAVFAAVTILCVNSVWMIDDCSSSD